MTNYYQEMPYLSTQVKKRVPKPYWLRKMILFYCQKACRRENIKMRG